MRGLAVFSPRGSCRLTYRQSGRPVPADLPWVVQMDVQIEARLLYRSHVNPLRMPGESLPGPARTPSSALPTAALLTPEAPFLALATALSLDHRTEILQFRYHT